MSRIVSSHTSRKSATRSLDRRRSGFPRRVLLAISVIKPAKDSGTREKFERLHPAKKRMWRIFARTSHVAVKLSITFTAGSTRCEAYVVCRARRSKIRPETTLADQSIATKRISRATGSPRRTTTRSASNSRRNPQACRHKKHGQKQQSKRFHCIALFK